MLKSIECRYCEKLFESLRKGHVYCSDTCRKLNFKAKKRLENQRKADKRISQKLIKLSSSTFGKYIVREIRRAGTVQILQGHTAESLKDLVKLRRKCTAASGYNEGESLSTYELSHIYPAGTSKIPHIGILHPLNLTITPKEFNRKHSSKIPSIGYLGLSLSKADVLIDWRVSAADDSIKILKLARKYIGKDFDIWLKTHSISQTQKQALIKILKEAGLPPKMLNDLPLIALKNLATEEELPYFSLTQEPKDIRDVLTEELRRLKLDPNLAESLKWLADYEWSFEVPDMQFIGEDKHRKEFEKFLINQSLACLHGQPYETKWKEKEALKYFKKREIKSHEPYQYFDNDDIL